jgi:hypothetical protein
VGVDPNDIRLPDAAFAALTTQVVADVANSLGLTPADFTPGMRTAIEEALRDAFRRRFFAQVGQHAARRLLEAAGSLATAISEGSKSRLLVGHETVGVLITDATFKDTLAKSAQLQKLMFDALVTAGFTADQAMQLLEADVSGSS